MATGRSWRTQLSSVGQVESRTQKRIPAWFTRGTQFERDLEPQRIREFCEVRAQRVEPVGLVYLWPETN